MARPERSTDDYLDTVTAVEAFKAMRQHGLGVLPAAILAAGVTVAEAIADTQRT